MERKATTKILHTADLHLGRNYSRGDAVSGALKEARMQALGNVIEAANREKVNYMVIAGDLFDRVTGIPKSLIREVADAFGKFCGEQIIIIPGNHDYYTPGSELWNSFMDEMGGLDVIVCTENKPIRTGNVCFYPCGCDRRNDEENRIGWIDSEKVNPEEISIGIAHGDLDIKDSRYFPMTTQELMKYGMDLWLLGHIHIANMETDPATREIENPSALPVFMSGTHQQTDISDASSGTVYILEIDEDKNISAKTVVTNALECRVIHAELKHGDSLRGVLEEKCRSVASIHNADGKISDDIRMVTRFVLSGAVSYEDYENRRKIYASVADHFAYEPDFIDRELGQEVSMQMVEQATVEGSPLRRLLSGYADDPYMLDLAYGLLDRQNSVTQQPGY